jgi:cold shock CspA family protein
MKEATTAQELGQKLLGRIQRVIERPEKGPGKGYGFIVTDDRRKAFFHSDDVQGGRLPPQNAVVLFNLVKQTAKNRNDRALNVEILSTPG